MFFCILGFLLAVQSASASPNLMANLPLHFEASSEGYLAKAPGYSLHARRGEARIGIAGDALRLRFGGAAARSPQALEQTGGYSNYLRGRDPKQWSTRNAHYRKVRYSQIYPGVDVVFYGNARQLEYDFLLAPGADPGTIRMHLDGARSVRIAPAGDLVAQTAHGELVLKTPAAYQIRDGRKTEVASRFVLREMEAGFAVGDYDRSLPLVIDPVISFATYLGGNATDTVTGIALDASNNIYITGYTASPNFPVTANGIRTSYAGGGRDVFVAKLSAAGNQLQFATYLGGEADETPVGIVADALGNVTIAGNTESIDYPIAGSPFQGDGTGIFLSRISADGSQLLASTFLGGNETAGSGVVTALTRDPSGNLVLVGYTAASNFPITTGVYQRDKKQDSDAFVTRISPTLTNLLFSTFLGGDGVDQAHAVTTDAQANIYIVGQTNSVNFPLTSGAFASSNRGNTDAFVSKLNPSGTALDGSLVLGGGDGDFGRAIALGPNGHVHVAGFTYSNNFPTTAGVFQFLRPPTATSAFLTKIAPSFAQITYSTYFGSTGNYYDVRGVAGIFVDSNDSAALIGYGLGGGLPVTPGALQSPTPGLTDAFLAKFNSSADILTYSTFLGGAGDEFVFASAVDASNNLYLAGSTTSANLPVTAGVQQAVYQTNTDGFLAKVDMAGVSTSCTFALTPTTVTVDSLGVTNTVALATTSGCSWSAASTQSWVAITGGASGTGSSTITYRVDPNGTTASRNAQIRVGGATLAITQTASPCLFNIDPQNRTMPSAGGLISFLVTGITGCSWTATSNTAWMRLTGSTSGNGTGSVPVTVEENATGIPRNGSLTIARQWVHVLQPAATPQMAFDDVALTHPFADHIFLMKSNSIADTCNNANQYCPEAVTTRAQMALFIVRKLMNGDTFTYTARPFFTDVPATHPQFPHIQKMRDLGITSGCTATTYCPDDSVTRGQMAAFIIRARLGIRSGQTFTFPTTQFFTDVPSTDLFYSFIQKMKEFGITSGCTATEYCSGGLTTRGQMAVFVIRGLLTP
ncbi:MAG: SBBP repeat-containing protein [Bryobacterales bacterium]|nr:SBBP repeat-containing protein [Bryobacterales bacterium]